MKLLLQNKVKIEELGYIINLLIESNVKNWFKKEILFKKNTQINNVNKSLIEAFQDNKTRNSCITEIDRILDYGPSFHFRNYHNY